MKYFKVIHNGITYEDFVIKYVTGFPYGYFEVNWENRELKYLFDSPVFIICKEDGSLQLPFFSKIDDAFFYMSIATGILEEQLNLS